MRSQWPRIPCTQLNLVDRRVMLDPVELRPPQQESSPAGDARSQSVSQCWELRQGFTVIRLQATIFDLDVVERLRSLYT
jgi:hypothetical protein